MKAIITVVLIVLSVSFAYFLMRGGPVSSIKQPNQNFVGREDASFPIEEAEDIWLWEADDFESYEDQRLAKKVIKIGVKVALKDWTNVRSGTVVSFGVPQLGESFEIVVTEVKEVDDEIVRISKPDGEVLKEVVFRTRGETSLADIDTVSGSFRLRQVNNEYYLYQGLSLESVKKIIGDPQDFCCANNEFVSGQTHRVGF